MATGRQIDKFALFGERPTPIAPEFLHIEPISERSSRYQWTITPHSHPGIFQLLLLEAGEGVMATDAVEVVLAPGTLVALPSGCVHAFRFDPHAEGWVVSIADALLDDPRIALLCQAARSTRGAPRWFRQAPAAMQRLSWHLAELAERLVDSRSGELPGSIAAQVALIVSLALERLDEGRRLETHSGRRSALVSRLLGLIEHHYRDGWPVARYSLALGTTTPTLNRACREVLGKPPGEVILDRVLLEAMRSLTYTAAGISQIGNDLGFSDPAYFARFFKARTGITAGAFRRDRAWFRRRGP